MSDTQQQETYQVRVEESAEFAPHIKWVELSPGRMTECAIMKQDQYGNLFYFEVGKLDQIDRKRLFRLITNRHASSMELWDLMSNHNLGNGMNALAYFHQLVKVITPDGIITDPRAGRIGLARGVRQAPAAAAPAAPASDEAAS
jgi:hypothetical protein